ncbi:hypothetical protein E3O06_14290 [Cryobacterium glaciale]|uniref:DUF559 domain-containing protein n=1 Tax=Cryobacterium glaciale TaxID=1259145 RepID=A0A4R8URK0_9MICO|nr:hypothetical protein [Cryobacterium glaciale]TFB70621.1 hypothetical protein E3O06_14290 [Cryobacterium glaciale]
MSTSHDRATLSYRRLRADGTRPASVIELAKAYSERMPAAHAFSHATAGIVQGLWLPHRLEADRHLHVSVPAGARAPQMLGIVGHKRDVLDIRRVGGLRVTSPLHTWIDVAPMLTRVELVAAADYLCGGRDPMHTPDELCAVTAELTGRRGCRALREAASLARAAVDSPQETRTRLFIVDDGIPEPVVNFVIRDSDGYFVARVDLAWPRFRVCVEYEGDGHRTDQKQFRKDITRRERVEDQNWRMVRITDDDLTYGGQELLRRVRAALANRGARS